jgi:MoCo/4Fe-4S cofactor protein with predicted Tat translocation signal
MSDQKVNTGAGELASVRARLKGAASGRDYWRSLDDLASTPEFQDMLQREFPRQAVGWSDDEDPVEGRRSFLKLMGASLALAGLSACTRQPTEHIMPYVRQPEELIPGRPLFFATATTLGGVASGVLAESHEGRPTKLEGNPEHPATLGACDIFSQASVLQLYDPDRSQALTFQGEIRSWGAFLGVLRGVLAAQKAIISRSSCRDRSGTNGNPPGRTAPAPRLLRPSASRSTPITIWRTPT